MTVSTTAPSSIGGLQLPPVPLQEAVPGSASRTKIGISEYQYRQPLPMFGNLGSPYGWDKQFAEMEDRT